MTDAETKYTPEACPMDDVTPKWRLMPHTATELTNCDALEEWAAGDGYDIIPEKARELLDGIDNFSSLANASTSRLMQICGTIRELETEYYERREILERLKKVKPLELLAAVMPAAFRAGFIYAEKCRAENGGYALTRFDD